jgi:hypothetical protein
MLCKPFDRRAPFVAFGPLDKVEHTAAGLGLMVKESRLVDSHGD